jgi:hypothetical protein
MRRLAGAVIGVAAILGMKYYGKVSAHDNVRTRLVELCAGDSQCQTAVQTHYDSCFETAYKMGGRHEGSKLDANALVACVNHKSGEEYFTVDEKPKQP